MGGPNKEQIYPQDSLHQDMTWIKICPIRNFLSNIFIKGENAKEWYNLGHEHVVGHVQKEKNKISHISVQDDLHYIYGHYSK